MIPTLSTFDAIACINQTVEYVSWEDSGSADAVEIEISYDRHNRLEKGITDAIWFCENIFCLITNALKYSIQPGGVKVEIKNIRQGDKFFVEFIVQDSGNSLSPPELSMLFDPPIQVCSFVKCALFFENILIYLLIYSFIYLLF